MASNRREKICLHIIHFEICMYLYISGYYFQNHYMLKFDTK